MIPGLDNVISIAVCVNTVCCCRVYVILALVIGGP